MDIGIRVYSTKAELGEAELLKFGGQVDTALHLGRASLSTPASSRVVIISNEGLPESGKKVLTEKGAPVVYSKNDIQRRRKMVDLILGRGQRNPLSGISNADMLNAFLRESRSDWSVLLSSDFAAKPDYVLTALEAFGSIKDTINLENVALVGVATGGNHNFELIEKLTSGEEDITLENISSVFPNNSFTIIPSEARFSGLTDNGVTGNTRIGESLEPIGGNEDFFYGLEQMLNGNNVFMMYEPNIPGDRVGEVSSITSKYTRRNRVYQLYAERLINRKVRQLLIGIGSGNIVKGESTEKDFLSIIDNHFFFVEVDTNGDPHIRLTKRQKENGIPGPGIKNTPQ